MIEPVPSQGQPGDAEYGQLREEIESLQREIQSDLGGTDLDLGMPNAE